MQWHDVFILIQGHGDAHRNGFLADPAEPFAYFSLSEQNQHFFLDHARFQYAAVQLQ
jgi:hypothetical protein